MTGPTFHVIPIKMRAAAKVVTEGSNSWLSDLESVRSDATPAFGKGEFAHMATTFHSRTHTRSIEYYREVGEAGCDVGAGIVKMSNLYEAVEDEAVDEIKSEVVELLLLAEVGLL